VTADAASAGSRAAGASRVLLETIEAEQSRLRTLLAGGDAAAMAERPPNGNWSVVENVRHLLFAEQAHLGRFLPGGVAWSPLGLPPRGMQGHKRLPGVGSMPSSSVEDVLQAWEAAHAPLRSLMADDSKQLARALERHLRHLRAHVRIIERLLRRRT
jgi:hypothetical protein